MSRPMSRRVRAAVATIAITAVAAGCRAGDGAGPTEHVTQDREREPADEGSSGDHDVTRERPPHGSADDEDGSDGRGQQETVGPTARAYEPLPDDLTLTRELLVDAPEQVTAIAVREGDGRLYLGDKSGRVWVVGDARLRDEPFLDLSDRVLAGGQSSEQGLLSIAFHPNRTDRLFVYYVTENDDDTRLSEFTVAVDGERADPDSERTILDVEQPFRWHNGGHIVFGPDGMLWLSLGDGGLSGDPELFAQDPHSLLGSIVRIDVDATDGDAYAVPDDNPYADGEDGAPEVWAKGLRNPWRIAFDPVEWRLYVADVGQWAYEWINVVGHGDGGANFGWPVVEGSHCFPEHDDRCPGEGFTEPVLEYGRDEGSCAVIGGQVYDGELLPALAGHFFYTDFCGGWLRSFRYDDGEVRDERDWTEQLGAFEFPVAVGADVDGELLVSDELGSIWRLGPG